MAKYKPLSRTGSDGRSTSAPPYASSDEEEDQTMNASSGASIASKSTRKSTKSRARRRRDRVDNAALSEPLTANIEHEDGDDQQWDGSDVESGSVQPTGSLVTAVEDDPFHVFREDLTRKLDLVDEALARYLRVVDSTDTAVNTAEVKDAKKHLKRQIKNAESALKDLQTTVTMVESNRKKFFHINDAELHDRRKFVTRSRDCISKAKKDMNSDDVKAKILTDERRKAARRAGEAGAQSDRDRESASFVADQHAQAQIMLQQQDETLEDLDDAVVRVGQMAGEIHEELGQQNKMLQEMEDDLADAEEKLGMVMGKLAKMLKTKNKCQIGTILCLTLVVFILFFLVIYT
uniref:t-SNARE coiled-coil homology domain-containing protein n=1 Tax=Odontella aurita TaxID=265563 RepID=A0A7S4J3Q8_9STRA|mmetsp:Transcript_37406/g.112100  ORF Transcript_37406/g.112100 Transcript_37406/m.112100 type:complete len:348 (+) Transcript_37406:119-1162(+)